MTAFPELLVGREDGFVGGPWTINRGTTHRGGASCNLTERVLTVPLEQSPVARVVRAHELTHARISPYTTTLAPCPSDVSPRALECAEEYRVNTVLATLGFDVTKLGDGSEGFGGRRLAEGGQWDEAVCFLLAVLGTGGERAFLSSIRKVAPAWGPALGAVAKQARLLVQSYSLSELGSTSINRDGIVAGWGAVTVPLARMVTQAMGSHVPSSAEELRRFRRSLQPGGRRSPSGRWADLLVAPRSCAQGAMVARRGGRRLRPGVTGVSMRYPSRLLTDPHCRAFGQLSRDRGGIIVIDQSGSMDVSREELVSLLDSSPSAVVIGYSHRPGDVGVTPNCWVLADARGVMNEIPTGNIGNGVDLPALRWALQWRRAGERVLWVTDGQVTDSHDHPCDSLSLACAQLVQREQIQLVRSVESIGEALRGRRWSDANFGRVGRALAGL